jgi:hypothetical protein
MARGLTKLPVGGVQDAEAARNFRRLGEWAADVDKLIAGNFASSGSGSGSTIIVPGSSLPASVLGWTDDLVVMRLTNNTEPVAIGQNTALTATRFSIVNAGATTDVVATLKAIASQSGDMLDVQNSAGAVIFGVDKNGSVSLCHGTSTVLAMGTREGTTVAGGAGVAATHAVISWGDNGNALGPPATTADYIGTPGARFYTFKDQAGVFDNGYGQDALDAWVLVCDDNITYSIWSVLTAGGTPYLRAQWAGNGDMEQRGILNIKKSTKAAGSLAASTPALRLWSTGSSSPSRYTGIQAAATVTSTHTLMLPPALGSTTGIVRVDSTGAVTYDTNPVVSNTTAGANVNLTAQTADIATTNLLASGHTAGLYRVDIVTMDTAADVTAGAVSVTLGWTDNVGATTKTGLATQLLTGTGRTPDSWLIRSTGAAAITYATAHTGIFGTAAYAVYIRVEYLG